LASPWSAPVVGEYLGSAAGLGYLIQQAEGVSISPACSPHVRVVRVRHPDRCGVPWSNGGFWSGGRSGDGGLSEASAN